MRCAESDSSTMAPANMAVSLITRRPAPDNRGKPNSPLPRLGTHTSGVVIRNDKVPMVIMMARISPMIPIRGKNNPKKYSDGTDQGSQAVGESVCSVCLMPFPVLDHIGSFRVFVFLVFRGLFIVEKTHEWTVGNERYNPVSLVVIVFQTSDTKMMSMATRVSFMPKPLLDAAIVKKRRMNFVTCSFILFLN